MTPCGANFALEGLCVGLAVSELHGHSSAHRLANFREARQVGGEKSCFLDVIL